MPRGGGNDFADAEALLDGVDDVRDVRAPLRISESQLGFVLAHREAFDHRDVDQSFVGPTRGFGMEHAQPVRPNLLAFRRTEQSNISACQVTGALCVDVR
jgi:hypothetical protein